MTPFDTICAPITAPGGAVAIIRLSGPEAWQVAEKVFNNFPAHPASHRAYYGTFSHGDDGLILLFAAGHSYTGEESAELNVHGSPASVTLLIQQLEKNGARLARPGEFTERAFLNGRLDLSQAEAVNDSVRAITDRQLLVANDLRDGGLRSSVNSASEHLVSALAAIEASVDFSEEIGEVDTQALGNRLSDVATILNPLIINGQQGLFIREGIRIAIVGPPNAGKSSLLNRILGINRAIVTDIAGTTRDYVEETCVLGGFQCNLIDTAGLRESGDQIEAIGIQRARAMAAQADLIWYVFDGSLGLTAEDQNELTQFNAPVVLVANKADLHSSEEGILVSTYTGAGLDQLVSQLEKWSGDLSGLVPNRRHTEHLGAAMTSVKTALLGLAANHPPDLLVTHLRSALHELGLITGETADQDLLERIFRDFCIGK
ncbi:MAG: tRNA uridine-5-carboxymethylaminomethyl(34) synthesis GTPase MnmE [Armatimonadota bacterium]